MHVHREAKARRKRKSTGRQTRKYVIKGGMHSAQLPDHSSRLVQARDVTHNVGKACGWATSKVACPSPAGPTVAKSIAPIGEPFWPMPLKERDIPGVVRVSVPPLGVTHPAQKVFQKESAPLADAVTEPAGHSVASTVKLIGGLAVHEFDAERTTKNPSLQPVDGVSIVLSGFARGGALRDEAKTQSVNMLIPSLAGKALKKLMPFASKNEMLDSGHEGFLSAHRRTIVIYQSAQAQESRDDGANVVALLSSRRSL